MIQLVTSNNALAKTVEDYFRGNRNIGVVDRVAPDWADRPRVADYVLTRTAISSAIAAFAGALSAAPCYVCETSLEYLADKAARAHAERRTLVLVGAEYASPPKVTKRKARR